MVKVYYIALMEFEQDKINDKNGPQIVRAMADLQAVTGTAGESNLYQVNDPAGFLRVKAELKRAVIR
jgi:hypothetical protein